MIPAADREPRRARLASHGLVAVVALLVVTTVLASSCRCAAQITPIVPAHPVPQAPLEERRQTRSDAQLEMDWGNGLIIGGLVVFVLGALMVPISLILQGTVRNSFEPAIGSAIGGLSVGLLVDVIGVAVWLDGLSQLSRADGGDGGLPF